jgi:hypothetical protein
MDARLGRSQNGTFEKLGGGQLVQSRPTFANGWGSAEIDPNQTLSENSVVLLVH